MRLNNSVGNNCKAVALSTVMNHYGYPFSEAVCFGLSGAFDFSFSKVKFKNSYFDCVTGNNDNDYYSFAKLMDMKLRIVKSQNSKDLKKLLKDNIQSGVPVISRVSIDKYIDILAQRYFRIGETYTKETQKIFNMLQTSAGIHVVVVGDIGDELIQIYEQNIEKPVNLTWKCFANAANPKTTCIMHPVNTVYIFENNYSYDQIKDHMDLISAKAIYENMSNYLFTNSRWYGHARIEEVRDWIVDTLKKEGNHKELEMFPFFCDTIAGGGFYRRIYSHFLSEINEMYFNSSYFTDEAKSYMKLSRKWSSVAKMIKTVNMNTERTEKDIESLVSEIDKIIGIEYDLANKLLEKGEAYLNGNK